MALPVTFSEVKTDEQGRRYVVHKPSGVVYYVRDDHPVWGRKNNKSGPVTVYSRSERAAQKKAKKAAKKNERIMQRDALVVSAPVTVEYTATFIPVEGV
jgi:hypothetical protein